MTRLVHSEGGYLRSMQISNCQVFAYVEGATDRPFYERILRNGLGNAQPFRIVAAKELPGNTGGKPRIIEWFKSLRRKKALSTISFGKKFVSLFFLDKDIDDATNKRLRSPHVVYTNTYDIEGHLIHRGNFQRALADAVGITSEQAALAIGDPKSWTALQVENWLDWTALCMVSQHRSINIGCTFDRVSAVNTDLVGPVDAAVLADFKTKMRVEYAKTNRNFDRDFSAMQRKITNSVKSGAALRYFKGKWFRSILQKHAPTLLAFPDAQLNSIGERLVLALMTQVGISEDCPMCDEYRQPILRVASAL